MRGDDRRGGGRGRLVLAIPVLAALGFAALATFRVGAQPEIELGSELPGIGRATPVTATFEAGGRGLSELRLELVQGDRVELLAERRHAPRPPWAFWGERTAVDRIEVEVGSDSVDGLVSGEATLRASATPAGTWLRSPEPVVEELTLPVRLTPPSLGVLSTQHYPAQGGSEVVVYRVGATAIRDGVEVGDRWFPGWPLPGGGQRERFALFAVPFDLDDSGAIRLIAEDDVGNRASAAFVDRFFAKGFQTDDIEVSEGFMARVVPEILANTPGSEAYDELLDGYLFANRELRRRNAEEIERLAGESRAEFLWDEAFLQMPNAQVMSAFADRRTYFFEGEEIDRQDHLGFDLASVRKAPVPAANSGVVLLARYFGIYGNAVVLDHGYGLMSLYGHLSSISVEEGEAVERGEELGRTGETGLAGGDHLHFTLLLQGLPTNPVEWWDAGWIRDRIDRKLGEALPFEP